MIQTLSDALAERGYATLTPVQEAVTDPDLQEADLLVSAQTGSGKTVGFGLAIAPTLLAGDDRLGPAATPLALIVAPTRELAFQVSRELGWLYEKTGARVATCVGGMDMRDERRALERGAHIVVGTPGRLTDHIRRGSLDMSTLKAVVLDEADEMLDLGFREDLEFMLGEAPAERRTLLFSATVPPMIVTLAQNYQRDAVRVTTLSGQGQHADITYQALRVAQQDAENAIINVLRYHEAQTAIVFANTRATVNRLTARFANRGFAVVCLSGELSQAERSHALQAMRDGRARVCVATDVAARGIDLPNLELVVHAELPSNSETLLHRSGRTGRAGRKGISALIVPPRITKKAERLLQGAKVRAEWTVPPGAEDILRRDEERLLADPTWEEAPSESEAAFAERLLAQRSPEVVAAAYLRLFRTRHSAPEDLSSPDARPERKERAPFGPSSWFALSVGRDDRAEPRWLLPLVLRAAQLDKDAIGAIRVQKSETYVEIADTNVARFEAALGAGGEIEDGVTARRLDAPPELGRPDPAGPRGRTAERPAASAGRKPQRDRDRPRETDSPEPKAASPSPAAERLVQRERTGPKPTTPKGKGPSDKGDEVARKAVRAPRDPEAAKAGSPAGKPKKAAGKPWDKDQSKGGQKPRAKTDAARGKPAGKPGAKPAGKPAGRSNAANPSERFTPPGKSAKPRPGAKRGAGGMQPPRRRKD